MSVSEARYAHCDGYTEGCRFKQKHLVTCGADGELRIWDMDTLLEESPINIMLGSECSSVAIQDDSLFCASDGNRLHKVDPLTSTGDLVSEAQLQSQLYRTWSSEVLHLAADSKHVLASLADGKAIICKTENVEDDITLEGHKDAVISGAIDSKKGLAATASCDGSVRVWSLEDGRCIKKLEDLFTTIDGVSKIADLTRYHRLTFLEDSQLLVTTERSLKLFNAESFSLQKEVEIDEIIDDEEVIFTMTSDGTSRVAISTNQGLLSVYSLPDFSQIWVHKLEDAVSSISLPEAENDPFVLLSEKGELSCVTGINPKKAALSGGGHDEMELEEEFNPDEEILAGTGIDRKRKASDDDEEEGIDLGAIKSNYMPTILGENEDAEGVEAGQRVVVRETVKTVHVKAFHQSPFQVGEVPEQADVEEDLDEEDDGAQERRFLTYNHVGFVVCSMSAEESSIDVDFHNAADRHPLTLPNKGYTMAALDGHALVLASEDEMFVYLLDVQAGETPSWEVEIKHDTIAGVTVGQNFVAMATQNQLLRLFSPGGVQREIVALPGPLLCMAGASIFSLSADEVRPRDNLMILCHQGTGLDDRQNIICARYKVGQTGLTARPNQIPVGLPRKVKIVWAGYTEEFRPSYMNSKGILFVYSERMASWYPVFNSKERLNKVSGCFVVSVGERFNRLLYISCKKWSPRVRPLPVMVSEKLQIPVLDAASDRSQLEARYLRCKKIDNEAMESGMAKSALQMFALALKSDRLTRAMDIVRMESTRKLTLELLLEYSEASNRNGRFDPILRLIKKYLDDSVSAEIEEAEEALEETTTECEVEEIEPLKSQDLMPSVPLLAPKRVILGSLSMAEKNNPPSADVNPFKKTATTALKTARIGGLDDILTKKVAKPTPQKPIEEVPRIAPKQAKLNIGKGGSSKDEHRSPVQIFMDEIIDELKREKPDGSQEAWLKMAAERFRKLTSEQRSNYLQLSKNPAKRQKI